MPAIAFGLGWLGYTVTLYGVCLLRGWNISFGQLISPVKPYSGAWPPPAIPDTTVLPGQGTSAGGSSPGSSPATAGNSGGRPSPGSVAGRL